MKTHSLLAVVVLATVSLAVVAAEPPPSAPATVAVPASMAPDATQLPTPNQIVYAPRLPSAGELTAVGTAQGLTVERIVETSAQITAVYRSTDGQTLTVAYQLLPTAATPVGLRTTTPPPPAPVAAPPAVVYYTPPERVIYYETPFYGGPYYDPSYAWYPPVSFRLGANYGFRGGDGYRGHGRRH